MGGGGSKDNSGTVVAAGGGGRGPGRSSASSAAYDNLSPLDQAELKEVFNLFDTDKNGTIEEHEIHTAMEELGFSNVTSEEIQDMMRFADKDNNGRLDLYEFAEMMNSRMGSREAGVEQLKVFEIMCQKDDASLSKEREGETPVPRRDGGAADLVALHDKVTREDLIRIATQLGENVTEEDVQEMIRLATEESLDKHKGFVELEDFMHVITTVTSSDVGYNHVRPSSSR